MSSLDCIFKMCDSDVVLLKTYTSFYNWLIMTGVAFIGCCESLTIPFIYSFIPSSSCFPFSSSCFPFSSSSCNHCVQHIKEMLVEYSNLAMLISVKRVISYPRISSMCFITRSVLSPRMMSSQRSAQWIHVDLTDFIQLFISFVLGPSWALEIHHLKYSLSSCKHDRIRHLLPGSLKM